MRIHIYYGGRGFIEDPTIYVINKLTDVLKDIRVEVERYNLFEEKNGISMLPKTLKEADGIILATTVEWYGIGGLMQQFLDACWLYGDKEHISKLYMLPVVLSTSYGEQEGENHLKNSWSLLKGKCVQGITAYVEDHVEFETNTAYLQQIEKTAEAFYRVINQKSVLMPSSLGLMKHTSSKSLPLDLTPQETEQLSIFISDDTYVKKQKEDIEELTQIFKGMLGQEKIEEVQEDTLIAKFKSVFQSKEEANGSYGIVLEDLNKTLVLDIKDNNLSCYYNENKEVDVLIKTTSEHMKKVCSGRISFQRAFMSGEISAKGNFRMIRLFDQVFPFQE